MQLSEYQELKLAMLDGLPDICPPEPKPRNTRTKKTVWKERRRLANAPKSIQKRVLKRM